MNECTSAEMTLELEERYSKYTTEDLLRILCASTQYTPLAVDVACNQVLRRHKDLGAFLSACNFSDASLFMLAVNTKNEKMHNSVNAILNKNNFYSNFLLDYNNNFNKYLDFTQKTLPSGLFFDDFFERLSSGEISEKINDVFLLTTFFMYRHIANSLMNGVAKNEIVSHLQKIGLDSALTEGLFGKFYDRVVLSFDKQKPNFISYFYGLCGGFLAASITGYVFGRSMLSTKQVSNHDFFLISFACTLAVQLFSKWKKGAGIACIATASTLLAYFIGFCMFGQGDIGSVIFTSFHIEWICYSLIPTLAISFGFRGK